VRHPSSARESAPYSHSCGPFQINQSNETAIKRVLALATTTLLVLCGALKELAKFEYANKKRASN
jgi:hypothetical protein